MWPFNLIARRQARRLFDLSAGFVYSQVYMSCVALDWFNRLAGGPVAIATLADEARLPIAAAQRLLRAAHTLQLTEPRAADSVALGPLGAAMIGDPGIAAMAAHHHLLYADMSDPLGLLRGEKSDTALSRYWGYATSATPEDLPADDVAPYSALMAASQPMIAEQVLAALSMKPYEHILDIGGGVGAFLDAVHARYPHLRRTLFDLPGVIAARGAREDDVTAVGGSFLGSELPAGADLISLVRIVHDHDDDVVLKLLSNIRQIIPKHGTLLIAEPMAGTGGAETVGDVYFGFYLLAMGSGRARTLNEINELLGASGFSPASRHKTPVPLIASVLTARPI
ncbi:MAG: methyltransferase [Pseudomonadota bacterium]